MNEQSGQRSIVAVFLLYFLIQLVSAAALYGLRQGYTPATTYAYYAGSEAAMLRYPGTPDRYLQAKTYDGILKLGLAHVFVYGLTAFVLGHLLRSSCQGPPFLVDAWLGVYYALCAIELAAPFLTRALDLPGSFRLASVLLYLGSSLFTAGWLAIRLTIARPIRR